MQTTERRQHPRVTAGFKARLGTEAAAVVHDISRSGVRCSLDTPVSAMTVVELRLEIPVGTSYREVPCRGVVVRTESLGDESPRYEAAIFFQDLAPEALEAIDAYVARTAHEGS